MLATDALIVSAIKVPKSPSAEKSDVEVALVAIRFVVVLFVVMLPEDDAAPNEIDPALKLPPTVRSPEREVTPDTEREPALTEEPEIEPPVIVGSLMLVPES